MQIATNWKPSVNCWHPAAISAYHSGVSKNCSTGCSSANNIWQRSSVCFVWVQIASEMLIVNYAAYHVKRKYGSDDKVIGTIIIMTGELDDNSRDWCPPPVHSLITRNFGRTSKFAFSSSYTHTGLSVHFGQTLYLPSLLPPACPPSSQKKYLPFGFPGFQFFLATPHLCPHSPHPDIIAISTACPKLWPLRLIQFSKRKIYRL